MHTLEELKKGYQANGERFAEIKDVANARFCMEGNDPDLDFIGQGPIAETGWFKLAEHRPKQGGMHTLVLVCKASLLETA